MPGSGAFVLRTNYFYWQLRTIKYHTLNCFKYMIVFSFAYMSQDHFANYRHVGVNSVPSATKSKSTVVDTFGFIQM